MLLIECLERGPAVFTLLNTAKMNRANYQKFDVGKTNCSDHTLLKIKAFQKFLRVSF
jgi:hypothetical protein